MIKKLFSKLISAIKSKFKNKFKVSCIVLCYNGEKYIEKRLRSIIDQRSKPFEIIFLDDASKDNSVELANKVLKGCKIKYRIVVNKQNIGCGNQIIKGISEAKGNFIWFAEQDDYCNKEFLYKIKKMYKDRDVNIAYCKSIAVDKNYKELEYYYTNEKKLNNNYCIDGIDEITNKLCIKNTIYDISSVVFRKTALTGVEQLLQKFKVFYDWIFYVYVLRDGKISYCADSVNYHMRHTDSIIGKKRKTFSFYKDLFTVKNYIIDNYILPQEIMFEMLYEIKRDYRMYGCNRHTSLNIYDHPILSIKYTQLQRKIKDYSKKRGGI